MISQDTLSSTTTSKPRITRQLDWEIDLNLIEEWLHFCVHKNEMKYNREFFVTELEKAMRTYMHLNKDVRNYTTKQLLDKIDSLVDSSTPSSSSPAPSTPTPTITTTTNNNTKIDHFI